MVLYKVLLSTVLINCLVKGTLKSLGVMMLELDGLGVDTKTASWIPAIAYTLFAVLSTPVARYSEKLLIRGNEMTVPLMIKFIVFSPIFVPMYFDKNHV